MARKRTIMWPKPKFDWDNTTIIWVGCTILIALCVWALSCSLHVHLKDIHYHGTEPPAEIVIEIPRTGETE